MESRQGEIKSPLNRIHLSVPANKIVPELFSSLIYLFVLLETSDDRVARSNPTEFSLVEVKSNLANYSKQWSIQNFTDGEGRSLATLN